MIGIFELLTGTLAECETRSSFEALCMYVSEESDCINNELACTSETCCAVKNERRMVCDESCVVLLR